MNETNEIDGLGAIKLAQEISKIPDGYFTFSFFQCNRTKGIAGNTLRTEEGCKMRPQLPQERFSIPSDSLFLYLNSKNEPKWCYRILVRFIGFPQDNYKLRKINWL